MKAAVLYESLTGNTQRAGERIAALLQQEGWSITGFDPVRQPNHAALQEADFVLVGTWVHGLFVVGQAPWGIGSINHLPSMRGKKAAVFCTFALNPGRTLDKMSTAVMDRGADVLGGVALNRAKLEAHSDVFVERLLANLPPSMVDAGQGTVLSA